MFIERHTEGNYKTKHAETRLGSTILRFTYTYTDTDIVSANSSIFYRTNEQQRRDGMMEMGALGSNRTVPIPWREHHGRIRA